VSSIGKIVAWDNAAAVAVRLDLASWGALAAKPGDDLYLATSDREAGGRFQISSIRECAAGVEIKLPSATFADMLGYAVEVRR
jgi:hypothetical protein